MNDPDVKTASVVLRAIPLNGKMKTYNAVRALHSLVWELWQVRDALASMEENATEWHSEYLKSDQENMRLRKELEDR